MLNPLLRNLTITAAIAVASCGVALADNTLFAPMALLVPANHMDIVGYYDGGAKFWRAGGARLGLPGGFEINFGTARSTNGTGRQNLDFEYQYLAPVPGTAPGFAFGVLDSMNTTTAHRRFYAVMTEQLDMHANLSHDLLANVSIGYEAGVKCSPFVGVKIPLGTQFALLAEHDGFAVNGGIEFDPIPNLALVAISKGSDSLLKVRYRVSF